MNPDTGGINRLDEIIQKSTSIAILLPQNPSLDAVMSALSLTDVIRMAMPSKYVSIACSTSPHYDGIDSQRIQTNITAHGNNLIVSFPYTDGSIDKVDYNIQGSTFNLVIVPRTGAPKLNPQDVQYSYAGGTVDTIITIDAPSLNSLGSIYADNQSMFQGKEIINIDRHLTNGFFGSVNIVRKNASSLSEVIFELLSIFPNVQIDKEIATNLYMGISSATNNFTSYSVNADTFETVAKLMRLGAAKKRTQNPPLHHGNNSFETQGVKKIQSVEKEVSGEKTQTPQDWLKPKIFHGGGLI